MKKKINLMLRKCKSLSMQLGRSSSYSSLRSHSIRQLWGTDADDNDTRGIEDDEQREVIYVGSSRKRYVISSKHLKHPLLNALVEKKPKPEGGINVIKCEVVLFDHLLWMLQNADLDITSESMEELAQLYAY